MDFSPPLTIRPWLPQHAILAWSVALQGGDVNLAEELTACKLQGGQTLEI